MKYFLVTSYESVMAVLFRLPSAPSFDRVKAAFLRVMGARVGDRVGFEPGAWLVPGRGLALGSDVRIGRGVLIGSEGGVTIGDGAILGARTQILSANHAIPPAGQAICGAGADRREVKIGTAAWIGANCLIMPGVEIGDRAVVLPGSVVTRAVANDSCVMGRPAKVVTRGEWA